MAKWHSYGFRPEEADEERRARQAEDDLVRAYLPVILDNFDAILETPRYFFCQPRGSWFSSL